MTTQIALSPPDRPIRASDLPLEREFVVGLSPHTRYQRLLSGRRLLPGELRRLTDIDYARELGRLERLHDARPFALDDERIAGLQHDIADVAVLRDPHAAAPARDAHTHGALELEELVRGQNEPRGGEFDLHHHSFMRRLHPKVDHRIGVPCRCESSIDTRMNPFKRSFRIFCMH